MVDPADPQDEENLSGGWYELAVEFDRPDEVRVDAAVRELSRLAGVEPVTGGHGLRLPDGARVVCTYAVIEDGPAEEGEAGGSVWVVLGLPLGSLVRVDPRVGAYPFGEDSGASWRPPLDAWLASLAVRLFDLVPFSLALVGCEVSGSLHAAELADGPPAEHAHVGIVRVTERPTYHPATM